MSAYREQDEESFRWEPDEPVQPFSRSQIAIAMIIRLIIIGAVLWWIFGQFSSDLHKLFQMGRTFILR